MSIYVIFFILLSAFETRPQLITDHPILDDYPYNFVINPSYIRYQQLNFFASGSQLYSLADLTRISAGFSWGLSNQGFSILVSQLGNDLYREIYSSLGYARRFSYLNIGVELNPMYLYIQGYGQTVLASIDFGSRAEISHNLIISINIDNIASSTYGSGEHHPYRFIQGYVHLCLLENHQTTLAVQNLENHPFRFSIVHTVTVPYLDLSLGLKTNPNLIMAGFQAHSPQNLNLGYNVNSHPELGYTHSIFLGYHRISEYSPPAEKQIVLAGDTLTASIFPLDINKATQELLTRIPGIGPVTAARIISWRNEHGDFEDIEQLLEVRGIGEILLEKMKPNIIIEQ
ncbi:MAG: hypothetical protein APR63_00620 [Desulfuromonas sp. SDB]|nr:MAG: hypothetical protein APR63_00620 [Desulfuromonas sp. SDB]